MPTAAGPARISLARRRSDWRWRYCSCGHRVQMADDAFSLQADVMALRDHATLEERAPSAHIQP